MSPHEALKIMALDQVEDFVLEIHEITQEPVERCRRMTTHVIESYADGKSIDATVVPRSLQNLLTHVTQPVRIPSMTDRMGSVLENLGGCCENKTCLDYGGGGGKDSILYAKSGCRVTYADLLNETTFQIRKRFDIRGLDIEIADVRDLGERRFDIINCMDVIEHVYDVEFVVADLLARLDNNGILVVYPQFSNSWNGDHIEKNCGYRAYFQSLIEGVGFELVADWVERRSFMEALLVRVGLGGLSVMYFKRVREVSESVSEERARIRNALYRLSRKNSMLMAMFSIAILLPVALLRLFLYPTKQRQNSQRARFLVFSQIIDNLAIWRLSNYRLQGVSRISAPD